MNFSQRYDLKINDTQGVQLFMATRIEGEEIHIININNTYIFNTGSHEHKTLMKSLHVLSRSISDAYYEWEQNQHKACEAVGSPLL
jgi:hypothetical protein